MKKITSLFLALVMTVLSLCALSSCEKKQQDVGAEISVYLSDEIYDLDPAASYTDDNCLLLLSMIYEPLFVLNDKGRLENAAAKDYEIDRDTGDLLIELRESYWSTGERVLAKDFVYAWRRILDPNFSTPAAPLLYDIKNAVKIKTGQDGLLIDDLGVYALDEKTLRICFEDEDVDVKAFLRNLASVALSPVYQTNVEQGAEYWAKSANSIYCNGPFKLRQLNFLHGYLTLGRNDGYHRKDGRERAVDAFVTPSLVRTLWNTDKNTSDADHLDRMYNFIEEKVVFYVSTMSIKTRQEAEKVKTEDRLSTYTYAFNTENPLFSDPAVRLVLSQVLSRDDIVENYVIYGEAATGLVPPAVMNHKRRSSFRKEGGDLIDTSATLSIDAANQKLDELGAIRGSFSIKYNENHEDEVAIATYVYDTWSQLGYSITLIGVSSVDLVVSDSVYREAGIQLAYETGDYDVIGIDYQMFSANAFAGLAALSSTLNGNGYDLATDTVLGNNVGWANEDYDTCIADALYEYDAKEKADLLHRAEEILMEQMPVMPLYFKQTYYVQSRKLKRVEHSYNGFPVFTKAKLKGYQNYFFDDLEAIFFPSEEE